MNSLKKLWIYAKPYRFQFVIVLVLGAIMSGASSATAVIVKFLFEEGFGKKDLNVLTQICIGIVGLYLIHGTARFFHLYVLKFTTEKIIVQMQRDLQDKYMTLSLRFHTGSDSGGHISRILNDVTNIQWGLNILADIAREPLQILFLIGWIIYLDWKLTVLIFIVSPLIVLFLKSIAKSVRKYGITQQETLERFTSTLKETFDGIRVIQSFNLENEMRRRLKVVTDLYLFARQKIIRRQEGAGPVTEFLGALAFAMAAYYMGREIIADRANVGDFVSFIAALGLIQPPIKKLEDAYVRIQQTIVSTDRIFQILEDSSIVPQRSQPLEFPKRWQEIDFENVTFKYGDEVILRNVNLKVKRGQVIAFVGESGSGKSTLVNLLERFIDPFQGRITIGGEDLRDLALSDLRHNIALVTQDVFLFNDTISRNIQSGNFDQESVSIETAAQMANAHDFIMKTPERYETKVGDRGARLSGGEKQRISIARAVYKNAPILILDEATSALDSASELEVQKGLDRLMEGRTTFVVAHRLSTVLRADRIFVLDKGQIVEDGTHDELLARRGRYHHFFTLQTQS